MNFAPLYLTLAYAVSVTRISEKAFGVHKLPRHSRKKPSGSIGGPVRSAQLAHRRITVGQ
ncbi:hypothetical protein BSFA1_86190 (plasmid) [Burkholderia sp. SFA1]|nr:hypothetical protein BSFA1_86190 [Burkholderia sp. SFA1]